MVTIGGFFVSAGAFPKAADEFARHQAKRHVTLVDWERLVDLWVEFYQRVGETGRRRFSLTPIHFLTPKV